ncbi:hypothetical protein M3649_19020 [Ureibacillus chungkukjangi]|uniref:hypothetical protein n=1 Tax=Ureibacillus chungkukjangi TaxID=1202712 RepID=UPI00203C5EF6|nr:hypothetical protein [Ureibacillus chungkukjangi]MCM3390192.1 hypothetical protein [Ureibacillus chungkukjangi]
MTRVKFGVGTYSYGYVNGKRYFVENTAEQIAAFIMKYRYDDKVIASLFGELEIKIMGEFIDFCQNQYLLQEALLPVLVPMQQGSLEIPEFVPYRDDNWKVKNVRVLAQTGEFFLADLEYIDRECNVCLLQNKSAD